jgi:GT2 family glycosyltransferase
METAMTIPLPRDIAAISATLDPSVEIVVCIPSFRRPTHLRQTLASLATQQTARPFAVVVVENDATGRAAVSVTREVFASGVIGGLCVVEPMQGNCHAINAAFGTARERFPAASMFLMIDDDEIATSTWLERMVKAAETTGAAVVGGPVLPNFGDGMARRLHRHPAFRPAYDRSGPVPIIYGSGNCLIRRSTFSRLADPRFDPRFNFLGGGDTDFFVRCRQAGLPFYWAADAVITETVPEARTRTQWLVTRGLRIGAINYRIETKAADTLPARIKVFGRIAARLPLSLWQAARLAMTEPTLSAAAHPFVVAVGSALAAVGIEPHAYKASKIAP